MDGEKDFEKKMNKMDENWEKKGEEVGEKIEKKFEKPRAGRIIGYIVAMVINIIILWVLNKLPDWNLRFLTESYTVVLWVINISLYVNIGGNILFIIYDTFWFKRVVQIIMNIAAFIAALSVFMIFPFDFEAVNQNWLTILVKIVLIVAIVGIGIGTIVEFVRLITGKKDKRGGHFG